MLIKTATLAFVLLCSTNAGFALPGRDLSSRNKSTHLTLRQVHRIYGRIEVAIAGDGVRVQTKGADYTFVSRAPDWDAVIYSDARKLLAVKKMGHWKRHGIRTALSIMDNTPLHTWPRSLTGRKNYGGLPAIQYGFPYRYENGVPASLKYGNFGEYTFTEGISSEKNARQYLQALLDVPPADGIPLRFTKSAQGDSYGLGLKYNRKFSNVKVLETLSSRWENKPLNLSLDKTKSYKRVDESAIVVKSDDFSHVFDKLMNEKTKDVSR